MALVLSRKAASFLQDDEQALSCLIIETSDGPIEVCVVDVKGTSARLTIDAPQQC
jgi:sRNA-binding carbon storage regulator CsrA